MPGGLGSRPLEQGWSPLAQTTPARLGTLQVCSAGPISPQGAYSAFVYSYAVEKPLSVGHKVAGYLPSLFWGFITLGRLISIPVSSRVKPATMVFINVVSGPFHCLETQKNRSPCAIALPQDTFSDWTLPQVGGAGRGGGMSTHKGGKEMLGWKPKACGPLAWSWKSPFLSLGLRLCTH